MSMFTLAISCLTTSNLPWFTDLTFQVPKNIVLYSIDFTPITSHIHNWVLFLLWLCLFILPGAISPLISSSILGTCQPEEFIFSVLSFCLFILFMGFARQEYWSSLSFPSSEDHVLSELSTRTHLVAYSKTHSFIELDKAVSENAQTTTQLHSSHTLAK